MIDHNKRNWIISQHVSTNHMYDYNLPYGFHLKMVADVGKEFEYLLDDTVDCITGKRELDRGCDNTVTLREACEIACWGHDLIEDTRVSYNDVRSQLGVEAADIIYAVSNEKGRNRKERANDKYYEGIQNTPGASFVKLCDRIANVKYGIMTNSKMVEMYRKENMEFAKKVHKNELQIMVTYLAQLFKMEFPNTK